ncbi:MAG: hypothetical protein WCP33_05580 [Deltaproteobacteria bacterium]
MNGVIGKTRALFARKSFQVDKAVAVRLIGDAWITFVTKTLTTTDTLGHPDIAEELYRLEQSGELATLHTKRGAEIKQILTELLSCSVKSGMLLCQQTDISLLALALDRIQNTTFKFVEFGRPDREAPLQVIQPLLELFHQMLLEDPQEIYSLNTANR